MERVPRSTWPRHLRRAELRMMLIQPRRLDDRHLISAAYSKVVGAGGIEPPTPTMSTQRDRKDSNSLKRRK
jgi:hypothetical protein